jgi:hypothetical protein
MPQPKTTLRIELTTAQQAQIREATGQRVNVLELRLPGGLEPTAGQEGAAASENRAPDRHDGPFV